MQSADSAKVSSRAKQRGIHEVSLSCFLFFLFSDLFVLLSFSFVILLFSLY